MASRRKFRTNLDVRFQQIMNDAATSAPYDPVSTAETVQQKEQERLQQAYPKRVSQILGDFEPFFVEKAPEYYQGPDLSTRVAAHQFIPDNYDPEEFEYSLNPGQFAPYLIFGKVYVRWQKPRQGSTGLWVYGMSHPISLDIYRNFKISGSKGKYVKLLEQYGHGEVSVEPDELGI